MSPALIRKKKFVGLQRVNESINKKKRAKNRGRQTRCNDRGTRWAVDETPRQTSGAPRVEDTALRANPFGPRFQGERAAKSTLSTVLNLHLLLRPACARDSLVCLFVFFSRSFNTTVLRLVPFAVAADGRREEIPVTGPATPPYHHQETDSRSTSATLPIHDNRLASFHPPNNLLGTWIL